MARVYALDHAGDRRAVLFDNIPFQYPKRKTGFVEKMSVWFGSHNLIRICGGVYRKSVAEMGCMGLFIHAVQCQRTDMPVVFCIMVFIVGAAVRADYSYQT